MSDPSEHLVNLAREGDRKAATELLLQHYEKIYAYFRRLIVSEEDAADLTQKTFARVWVSLSSFQGRARFTTWLHSIAHHILQDWFRQKRPTAQADDEWWESRPYDGPDPFEDAAEREMAGQLYALVDQLDPEKREVVHLHYYQGLTLAETAEVLGVATSTIKYRLRESLDFLKQQLTKTASIEK